MILVFVLISHRVDWPVNQNLFYIAYFTVRSIAPRCMLLVVDAVLKLMSDHVFDWFNFFVPNPH